MLAEIRKRLVIGEPFRGWFDDNLGVQLEFHTIAVGLAELKKKPDRSERKRLPIRQKGG